MDVSQAQEAKQLRDDPKKTAGARSTAMAESPASDRIVLASLSTSFRLVSTRTKKRPSAPAELSALWPQGAENEAHRACAHGDGELRSTFHLHAPTMTLKNAALLH